MLRWDQHERDMAAETINRFVSRSLYRLHAFNGDPHPGNYLFHGRGRVSFLDFGLTKHFNDQDLVPLVEALRCLVIEKDGSAFDPLWSVRDSSRQVRLSRRKRSSIALASSTPPCSRTRR